MCDFCEKRVCYYSNQGESRFKMEEDNKMIFSTHDNNYEELGCLCISYCPICGRKLTDAPQTEKKPYGYVACDQDDNDKIVGFYSTLDEVKRGLGEYLDDNMLDDGEFGLLTVSKVENIRVRVTHSVDFI